MRAPNGAWLFCVADVTGHGVPAAMNAAMLKMLLSQAADQFSSPAEILGFVNERILTSTLEGDFVSMLVVRARCHSRTLEYASAGHEPGWLLFPDGTVHELASTGVLLGIEERAGWCSETIEIVDGTRLIMLSDGAPETLNARNECFGRRRFAELCAASAKLSVRDSLQQITDAMTVHRNGAKQEDDITVVLVDLTELTSCDRSNSL